jgi:hypothetical protein
MTSNGANLPPAGERKDEKLIRDEAKALIKNQTAKPIATTPVMNGLQAPLPPIDESLKVSTISASVDECPSSTVDVSDVFDDYDNTSSVADLNPASPISNARLLFPDLAAILLV